MVNTSDLPEKIDVIKSTHSNVREHEVRPLPLNQARLTYQILDDEAASVTGQYTILLSST